MTNETIIAAGLTGTLGLIGVAITYLTTRRQAIAGTMKLQNEAGDIILQGEFKLSQFYKNELESLTKKYDHQKQECLLLHKENKEILKRLEKCDQNYNRLNQDFILYKTQHL